MKSFVFALLSLFGTILFLESCTEREEQPGSTQENLFRSDLDVCEGGDDEEPFPMLSGFVKDSAGAPIVSACVEVETDQGEFVDIIGTDSNGYYFFNYLANDDYVIEARRYGYEDKQEFIQITGSPETVNFYLDLE